jgi:putative exosortase-associated protein (TIGR04073 family)
MNSRGIVRTVLAAGVLAMVLSAAWAEQPTIASPVIKLGQGVVHTVFSPLEFPMSVSKMTKTYGPFWGVTIGPVNGVLSMVERGVAGIIDVATFYVPAWDQPVLKRRFGETELTNPFEPAVRVAY